MCIAPSIRSIQFMEQQIAAAQAPIGALRPIDPDAPPRSASPLPQLQSPPTQVAQSFFTSDLNASPLKSPPTQVAPSNFTAESSAGPRPVSPLKLTETAKTGQVARNIFTS